MSDKVTHDKYAEASHTDVSRRLFLQGAGIAAAGIITLGIGHTMPKVLGQKPEVPPDDLTTSGDCLCSIDAELPLIAAAMIKGKYFGLIGSETGPHLVSLSINKEQNVSLEQPIKADLPEGFVFSSLGVFHDRLLLCGGQPFVIETLEIDCDLADSVRSAMDNHIPEGVITRGKQSVDIMGLHPAVFIADLPYLKPLELPKMPARSFAVVTAATETIKGGLALLIEHSDGVNQSYYAAGVDVIEEYAGVWNFWNAGRDLGESGPNYLALDGDQIVVGLNTSQGAMLFRPKQALTSAVVPRKILALTSHAHGISALSKEHDGSTSWSSIAGDNSLTGGISARLTSDEIVGAVTIAGGEGQAIMLGRKSSLLVDKGLALSSHDTGGKYHVM